MEGSVTRPRLLLADDEVLVRELVQESLEEAGYEVVAVSSGTEAIEALEAESDLIALVTDIKFGGPPVGWDVAARAREIRSSIAVVYMTGDSAHEWSAHGVPAQQNRWRRLSLTPSPAFPPRQQGRLVNRPGPSPS
jgi:two-component system cell cycle response regulator CpdR